MEGAHAYSYPSMELNRVAVLNREGYVWTAIATDLPQQQMDTSRLGGSWETHVLVTLFGPFEVSPRGRSYVLARSGYLHTFYVDEKFGPFRTPSWRVAATECLQLLLDRGGTDD